MTAPSLAASTLRKAKKSLTIRLRPPPPLRDARALTSRIDGYFNAAFLPGRADQLRLICRTAYYGLDARGFMVGDASPEAAQNVLVTLRLEDARSAPPSVAPAPEFDGLEDIRFFESGGQIFLFAIGFETSNGAHRPVPVLGRVQARADDLEVIRRTATEQVSGVEKNWVFFERAGRLHIEKFPGMAETYEVDRGSLELRYACAAPTRFTWSGTKAVRFDGGYLFLDHRRIYLLRQLKTVQRYALRFRHISEDGRTTRHSSPFSLGPASAMVYASDMSYDAERDRVLIAASENDAAFAIYGVGAETLRSLLR